MSNNKNTIFILCIFKKKTIKFFSIECIDELFLSFLSLSLSLSLSQRKEKERFLSSHFLFWLTPIDIFWPPEKKEELEEAVILSPALPLLSWGPAQKRLENLSLTGLVWRRLFYLSIVSASFLRSCIVFVMGTESHSRKSRRKSSYT